MPLNLDYLPHYVWPNTAIPFRHYFDHPNLRIFIIENISHNWKWMREASRRFQARDYFFVYCGWYYSDWFLKKDLEVFDALTLDKSKFFFLFNSADEMNRYLSAGFQGELINHNAWLDWNGPMRVLTNEVKRYDAVYTARPTPFKRHYLASGVKSLALITGSLHGTAAVGELPSHIYRNLNELSPDEVCRVINQSRVGLILSEEEGACFSSSEYLLSGVPVVSTTCRGGRDFWYDDYNSIVVQAEPSAIANAVKDLIARNTDGLTIRKNHIRLAEQQRRRFITALDRLFSVNSIGLNAQGVFDSLYIHKLRKSETVNINEYWP
jgi:glycosyltransferase involved in cell wall biosynthesis